MEQVITTCDNYIGGKFVPPMNGEYLEVVSPSNGKVIAKVALSNGGDIDLAVTKAKEAFVGWSSMTVKARASVMLKFHALVEEHAVELASLITLENGKNKAEALADVAKANETVEWACSMPQLCQGKVLPVSRGVICSDSREPLGVVASIVPFNFPLMVPMWTAPIALVAGNCMIMKPSEKVPLTLSRVVELMKKAGIPDGVFQLVNGAVDAVLGLCDHPGISAVTFVGSSKVAEIVYRRCTSLNKRVLALGGAKNHLVALKDCDIDMAAADITGSFAGCCGQRCMAASVLLVLGENQELIDGIVAKAKTLTAGQEPGQVGPCIDSLAQKRILQYIDQAEASGSKILLDGRSWSKNQENGGGFWVGPTIILHQSRDEPALHNEIFGPILSILKVSSKEEAIEIENGNPYGNAAGVYTQSGAAAEWFTSRFRAGMIGVNIGIPVPREPFSFGGLYGTLSKFGDGDITGEGAMEFFTWRRKVTQKWGKFDSGMGGDKAQFS